MIKTALNYRARLVLFFGDQGKKYGVSRISVDGTKIDDGINNRLNSELHVARFIIDAITSNDGLCDPCMPCVGITIETYHEMDSETDSFIQELQDFKERSAMKVILLHEDGIPALVTEQGRIRWSRHDIHDSIFVLGDHLGFRLPVENKLKEIVDDILCISTGPLNGAKNNISYLGSHVIAFISMMR